MKPNCPPFFGSNSFPPFNPYEMPPPWDMPPPPPPPSLFNYQPGMLPPMQPPPMPPMDAFGLNNPFNPMMIYQTNNYYGSNFSFQPSQPLLVP